jgi:effector-binding domain-containing protein
MEIQILQEPLELDLYGIGADVVDSDYSGTGRKLMDEMWSAIHANKLQYKGINFWVYDSATKMFVGVELDNGEASHGPLENKPVSLSKYVYYKHVGPYEKLGDIHRALEAEMAEQGLEEIGPRVEKYGHWTDDQSKLITEIFIAIR